MSKSKFSKEWRNEVIKKEGDRGYGYSLFDDKHTKLLEQIAQLTPLHDWVLVKKHFKEGLKTKSGIITTSAAISKAGKIVDGSKEERPTLGWVLSVGGEVKDVTVGDYINFPMAAGTTFEYLGEKVSIIKEKDINGILIDDKNNKRTTTKHSSKRSRGSV